MFKCKGCGSCCSNYLPLSKKEVIKLKNIVKANKIKPFKNVFQKDWKNVCPFLNSSNRCVIYDDRPTICKSFTCEKFKKQDFTNVDDLIKEQRRLVNLRKEIFETEGE